MKRFFKIMSKIWQLIVKISELVIMVFVFLDLIFDSVDSKTAIMLGILIFGVLVDIRGKEKSITINIVDVPEPKITFAKGKNGNSKKTK